MLADTSASLLGMTTTTERAYFEHYARSLYTGAGDMVDLGCWLGSTTICLAKGLVRNRRAQVVRRRVHAYDEFVWQTWMDDCVRGTDLEGTFRPGDSFLEEFRRRAASWADRIEIHPGDLCTLPWSGGPIEFLLVDVMKSWHLAHATVRGFFPFMIPDRSYLLHQDFAHSYASWIHLIHYRLRHWFRLVHVVPHSQSFVFKYVGEIPQDLLDAACDASTYSADEVDSAFAYSLSLSSDRHVRATIAASKVMHYVHAGDIAKARFEFDRIASLGLPPVAEVKAVQDRLR